MCGICGVIQNTKNDDLPKFVASMQSALIHRGPDSEGHYSSDGVSLAMRRLAIIDLETGDQPISNEGGKVWAILNGEIYNYRELTEDLSRLGHRFKSRSDTEVIVHGYEEYKEGLLPRLKGMFAFAVYDERDRSLMLARDRFGEKPLFYFANEGTLVFSSELKSLTKWPGISRRVDREALGYYLRSGLVPEPLTMFKGVFQIPAGCWLRWSNGDVQVKRYFEPGYDPCPDDMDTAEVVERVRDSLREAVRRQMVSDVPIGAFLSGGIDSSAVVANMQSLTDQPVKTFTVRFEESSYDESRVARTVAEHLGTDHHEIFVPNSAFSSEDLWRIIDHVGAPFSDSSAIPTYFISKKVRESVKVCLTGDGGDEMFAGYDVFLWGRYVQNLARIPRPLLLAAGSTLGVAKELPGFRNSTVMRKARRAVEAAAQPEDLRFPTILSLFSVGELGRLIKEPSVLSAGTGLLPRLAEMPKESERWTRLRRWMHYRMKNHLPQDMLTKIDRMSMAASLELRAPMLDPDLAALAMSLPDQFLIHGKIRKYVLREAVRPMLPEVVFTHPKSGFSIPLHAFQNDQYADLAKGLLDQRKGPIGLLDANEVEQIRVQGLSKKKGGADISVYRASHQLWALVQLAAWTERFGVSA